MSAILNIENPALQ